MLYYIFSKLLTQLFSNPKGLKIGTTTCSRTWKLKGKDPFYYIQKENFFQKLLTQHFLSTGSDVMDAVIQICAEGGARWGGFGEG